MKKIIYCLLIASTSAIISCEDTSLDPLQTANVKKGTILALRGQQLENIYTEGIPGAEFFPRIINGTETFDFDAEYLSEDPSTLESFDIYVLKKAGSGFERVLLKNVPGSEFKQTSDYLRPWVSVSIKLTDILAGLGITDYSDPAAVDELLTTYKFGVNLESDINLVDGSKVLAADIVAAGLFASDQFYPAQKLTYTVTDFCPYEADWDVTYLSSEVYSSDVIGPYDVTFTKDPGDPNKYIMKNFLNEGLTAYVVFTPTADDPDGQIVEFPEQEVDGVVLTGTGTYDQCEGVFEIETTYGEDSWRYEFSKP